MLIMFPKFILHLNVPAVSEEAIGKEDTETLIAFVDARRLGRIRLCADPLKEPPISTLGFDPLLCMPTLEEFSRNVLKRSCPIKALLLDQSFSAGVGNWVAGILHLSQLRYVLITSHTLLCSMQMKYFTMHGFILSKDAVLCRWIRLMHCLKTLSTFVGLPSLLTRIHLSFPKIGSSVIDG